MRDAYQRVLDLQDNGYIMDYSTISTGSLHYTGTFFNQQVATVYQGSWFITYLLEGNKCQGHILLNGVW